MKIPKEAKDITIAVLEHPELHWNSCFEDITGRPTTLDCHCPLREIINKISKAKE
jgi:hypothetical protein